jgi:phage replication O-like protein O
MAMTGACNVIELKAGSVAKLENGYTRIANDLLEAIARHPMTSGQMRVVLAIARLTYGYRKRSASISTRKIAEMCGFKPWMARYTVAALLSAQVLFREGGQRGEIGINNHVDQWRFSCDSTPASVGKSQHSTRPTVLGNPNTHDSRVLAEPNTECWETPTLGARTPYKNKKKERKEEEKESAASAAVADSDLENLPRQLVAAWNAHRSDWQMTPVIPPKRQARIQAALQFITQCVGYPNWPDHPADVIPWFSGLFAAVERGDLGDYLQGRDFDFFMDADRLHRVINEGYFNG